MTIVEDGITSSGVILNGNTMIVSSGGTAVETAVSSGGLLMVSSGGSAYSTFVDSGGELEVYSDGVATGVTVFSGGRIETIRGAASLTDVSIFDGGKFDFDITPETYIEGTTGEASFEIKEGKVNDITLAANQTIRLKNGCSANSLVCSGSDDGIGYLFVDSDSVAINTQLYSKGWICALNQGLASSTTVNAGGRLEVYTDGRAKDTVINSGGSMDIASGGVANSTTVNSGGSMSVFIGGHATDTVVDDWGTVYVDGGDMSKAALGNNARIIVSYAARITDISFSDLYGFIDVDNGGYASYVGLSAGCSMWVRRGGSAFMVNVKGWEYPHLENLAVMGGVVTLVTIDAGGFVSIESGGSAHTTEIHTSGEMNVGSGTVENTRILGGTMIVYRGIASNTIVNSGGDLAVSSGGMINGNLEIADGGKVTVYEGGIIDFTVSKQKSADAALINDISRITDNGAVYTLTVAEDQVFGDYVLAGNAAAFDKTITVKTDEAELGKLTVGNDFVVDGVTYALKLVDTNLVFMIDDITPPKLDVSLKQNISLDYEFEVKISEPASLQYKIDNGDWQDADGSTIAIAQNGTYSIRAIDAAENVSNIFTKEISGLVFGNPEKVETDGGKTSWTPVKDESGNVQQVVVQYSMDNFKTVVTIVTSESALKLWSLPDNVQWRVKGKNDPEWEVGEEIAAEKNVSAPQKIEAVADGVTDIFFARTAGRWTILHQARHQGIKGGWTGTQEIASLGGKSKIVDVFSGAADVDILYLTDQGNGDVLFVDDIFGDSFEGIAKTQARIANLDEIRAGAGDDIVDMTSQRFAYIGDGVTIYGGDGDDVIWSNKGDNKLFGDAGNDRIVGASGNDVIVGGAGDDRMHGGGGDDIFTFGDDWGNDTVDQLSGGTVTLWFEDGSEENWNADTRTYTDGENTVTVSGTADVTLKFGGDISSLPEGIFSNAVTKKIFESTLA